MWLQEKIQLVLQVLDHGVHLVTLGLQATEVVLLFEDFELQFVDFGPVVGFKSSLLLWFDKRLGPLQKHVLLVG
jgi:hypothetical protein